MMQTERDEDSQKDHHEAEPAELGKILPSINTPGRRPVT